MKNEYLLWFYFKCWECYLGIVFSKIVLFEVLGRDVWEFVFFLCLIEGNYLFSFFL